MPQPLGVKLTRMLMKIIIEIVLGIVMLFAGHTFWQLSKRKRFLKAAIQTPELLESLISREILSSPPPHLLVYVQNSKLGYALNIKCVLDADRASQRQVFIFSVFIIIAILLGSYFMGFVYLAINIAVFLIPMFEPISPSAKTNALEQILTIGLILHQWRIDNAKACDEFVKRAWSLRPLYDFVRRF